MVFYIQISCHLQIETCTLHFCCGRGGSQLVQPHIVSPWVQDSTCKVPLTLSNVYNSRCFVLIFAPMKFYNPSSGNLEFYKSFLCFFFFFACGCHLKSVTSAVESGQDQFTDSCWFHSLHQGCLLCDRWVRLLSGPLALGARFHNAHRDTLSMDRCQTLVDVTLRGHLA